MNLIFYRTLPMELSRLSTSWIRPLKMLEAFQKMGCNVYEITGYQKERKEKIRKIWDSLNRFDLLYMESATIPFFLTEKHHLPTPIFMDFSFFNECKRKGLFLSVFYRDIHWMFLELNSFVRRIFLSPFHKLELKIFNRYFDKIYLPSDRMKKYISEVDREKMDTLPPGHSIYHFFEDKKLIQPLKLFYVGGIGAVYRMHKIFRVAKELPVNLYFYFRRSDWEKVKNEYELSENIFIIFEEKQNLNEMYSNIDLSLFFLEPIEYLSFALAQKLFEYIGFEKPIIASEGTAVSEFVKQNDIGWVIKYDEQEFKRLIEHIINNPEEVMIKIENIRKIKNMHTWIKRAEKVINDAQEYINKNKHR